MRTLVKNIDGFLRDQGIKASYQRIRILDYLQNSYEHPSVSTIYQDLHPHIPSLSRATVYNTLNLFLEKKLVAVINTEGVEARYDIADPNHGHFQCLVCDTIFDIPTEQSRTFPAALDGFQVTSSQWHFKGVCPKCLEAKKQQ